jgi:agmatine deiminase
VRTGPLREEEKKRDFLGAVYRDFKVGDEVHWVPATSYLNVVISNGVVLVAKYWREGLPEREREKDEYVHRTLQGLFPDRRVVQIDPMVINMTGGGMHCATLQQPRVR